MTPFDPAHPPSPRLPSSLFYFTRGYVETSYDGQVGGQAGDGANQYIRHHISFPGCLLKVSVDRITKSISKIKVKNKEQ